MKLYRAMFKAVVDEGTTQAISATAKTGKLGGKVVQFDLAGSGTMPTILVSQPATRSADGQLLLDFARVHVFKQAKRKIVLRNDGTYIRTHTYTRTHIYLPSHTGIIQNNTHILRAKQLPYRTYPNPNPNPNPNRTARTLQVSCQPHAYSSSVETVTLSSLLWALVSQ